MVYAVFAVVYLALAVLGVVWTDRTLEFWLSKVFNHAVDVPWYLDLLANLIFNGVMFGLNLVSEIIRLAL